MPGGSSNPNRGSGYGGSKKEGGLMASKACNKAWDNYYKVKKETQKEYDKGNMTPNEYGRRVGHAQDNVFKANSKG